MTGLHPGLVSGKCFVVIIISVCFEVFQAGSHRLSQTDLGLGELSVPAPRTQGSKACATTGDIYLFTIILRQDLPT